MELNADFTRRVVVHGRDLPWVASPMAGVERRMLDRIGDEVARATTIVRYAPGAQFSPHTHDGGEEFLVLEGVFTDEHGDFPAGSYVRNPPTSRHTPRSAPGCTIFVKLYQFDPADRRHVRLRTQELPFENAPERPGVELKPLYQDSRETVRLERWASAARVALPPQGGMELFVLSGGFTERNETFGPHSWLRLPDGANLTATADSAGCIVWIKTGHLREPHP